MSFYQVRGDSEGNLNIWDVRTKSSRNITTKRGFVKKIRFAPGRGNMKLLVLHVDSVSIWDVKEAEIINELRSPKDLVSKPTDIGNSFHKIGHCIEITVYLSIFKTKIFLTFWSFMNRMGSLRPTDCCHIGWMSANHEFGVVLIFLNWAIRFFRNIIPLFWTFAQ